MKIVSKITEVTLTSHEAESVLEALRYVQHRLKDHPDCGAHKAMTKEQKETVFALIGLLNQSFPKKV